MRKVRMDTRKRWRVAVVAASALAVLSACGGGSGESHPTHSASPTPSSSDWLTVLHKQVQSKLTSGTEVFQGGEKGTSGGLPETWIQTPDDKEYVFEAACSGSAAMEFYPKTKKPHKEPERILACNGKALTYPFKGGDLITVKLLGSSTPGLLIWQVIRQPR